MGNHWCSLRLFLLLGLSFLGSNAISGVVDVSNVRNVNALVTSKFTYFEDNTGLVSPQDIISKPSHYQWHSIDRSSISFGFTSSTYWLKAELVNTSAFAKEFYLDIAYPKITSAQLYLVSGDQSKPEITDVISITSSDSITSRAVPHRHPIFPIALDVGQHQVAYLRLENKFALAVPIHLWEPEVFDANDKVYILLQGGYFGCMLAMLIYNMFIYFSTRDRSFLYYVLFIASLIFFSIIDRGFGSEYLWHDNGIWDFKLYVAFVAISVALATAFGRVYLSVVTYSTRYDQSLKVMEAVSWGLGAWALVMPSIELIMLIVLAMLVAGTLVILSALYVLRQGQILAKFYLFAWVVIIVGGVTHIFGNFGIVPFSTATEHMLQISNMIEAMLLSFGLGFRINSLKKERQRARIEAMQERENTEKEKEVNQAKTQFFATMSHEFRTPLTAILGYSELSRNTDISVQDKDKNIKTINQSAQYMLQLINDILDLSKIESQKMDVEIMPVNVLSLVGDLQNFMQVLADNQGIYFRAECIYPIPKRIKTDPTRLKQALINLCSNAIKFTKKGGVLLQVRCDEGVIYFSVIDTGIGIKGDVQDKLFSAFSQADSSTTRNFGGTGLGLYLSKIIANRLGGDIAVRSEFGKGSDFTITVDPGDLSECEWIDEGGLFDQVDTQCNQKLEEGKEVDGNSVLLESKRVLVVDDNPVNTKLLGFHLGKLGVSSVCVSDGVEAIARVLTEEFDVIFMDINMPIMDGVAAVKLLREKGGETSIYALTGSVDEESIKQFSSAGFTGYLPKPYDLNRIKASIQS